MRSLGACLLRVRLTLSQMLVPAGCEAGGVPEAAHGLALYRLLEVTWLHEAARKLQLLTL